MVWNSKAAMGMKSRKPRNLGPVYSSSVSITSIHTVVQHFLFLKKTFVCLLVSHEHMETFTVLLSWMKWRTNLLMY